MHANPMSPGTSQPSRYTFKKPGCRQWSFDGRISRGYKPLARRFVLGLAGGLGTGLGSFVILWIRSR